MPAIIIPLIAGLAVAIHATWGSPSALAQTSDLVVRSALRVCADPANLPFSSKDRTGFENKLAELFAGKLGIPVLYTWFPQATGFVRQTLRAKQCDVIIGFSQGHELVQNTNHYYRSSYVIVYRKNVGLDGLNSLADPRLKSRKIGVVAGTPPATYLAVNGLMTAAKPFPLMVDRRFFSPSEEMVREVASGSLDAGLLWGPIGGYFAKKISAELVVVPLINEASGPRLAFRITMGVRRNERDWKRRLNRLIAKHQDEINKILISYGVPLLDEENKLITAADGGK
ncbi:MAG: substrate-binding domain-containing protein [Hyphomicrobiaceae bacterium]